jgi:hypothetical protein
VPRLEGVPLLLDGGVHLRKVGLEGVHAEDGTAVARVGVGRELLLEKE